MIGEFLTRTLLLVLGYAYPAFQCFKTIERNRVEIPELRFWCQYWIIVSVITILEKIGDVFVSWLPMYGEMKLALFIYLWHPRTKGTGYIYESLLQPYMSSHETDIDRSLIAFREKAWNLAMYYWNNCTELGSTKILQFLQFAGSQAGRIAKPTTNENQTPKGGPPSSPPSPFSGLFRRSKPETRPPPPPSVTPSAPPISFMEPNINLDAVQDQSHNQMRHNQPYSNSDDVWEDKLGTERDVQATKIRLRRFIDGKT